VRDHLLGEPLPGIVGDMIRRSSGRFCDTAKRIASKSWSRNERSSTGACSHDVLVPC
jgi:hypothetical protein